jgi:hypothetical protein
VILSTAFSRERTMFEFAGREGWGFIRKPYETSALVESLHETLIQEAQAGRAVPPGA